MDLSGEHVVVTADLRSPGGVIEQAAEHGPTDVLVNNAGVDEVGDFERIGAAARTGCAPGSSRPGATGYARRTAPSSAQSFSTV
jgi:NAD(P)-dependent dehydrogenase (short-subunit alcohol dehydrogenase family)